jgi:hypothetical protein
MNRNTLGGSLLQNEDRIVIERKGVPSEVSLRNFRKYTNGTEPLIVSGSTLELDFANALLFDITLTAAATFTFVNATPGVYVMKLTQGGAGSNTVTFPSNVKWSGATPPILTTTVGAWDYITFVFDGTYFSATSILNFVV